MKSSLTTLFVIFSFFLFAQEAKDICSLNIGTEIPSAIIKSVDGEEVDLKKIASEKPTIILFYRGGWCPYCTRHLTEIRKIEYKIKELGFQVLALSTDDVKSIPETIKKQKLGYTLYSDRSYNAMNAFGISFVPSKDRMPSYVKVMEMDEDDIRVPVPAVFIVKEGVIQYRYVNPNYKSRITSEMLLSTLNSLK